jgi:hypothetical protein
MYSFGRVVRGGCSVACAGYTTKMVVHERFAIIIPKEYPLQMAGPVCVCVCVCVCVYVCVYLYTYVGMYRYTYVGMCVRAYKRYTSVKGADAGDCNL